MVWLTGGALVVSVVMVLGLLALVARQGMGTFWPAPVARLTTHDGGVFMGEITRRERFVPEPHLLEALPTEVAVRAREAIAGEAGDAARELVRTGNFRLTQNHFSWVADYEVVGRDEPAWAVVVERLEWGRFYGFPEAFVRIQPLVGEGSPAEQAARGLASLALGAGEEAMLVVERGRDRIALEPPTEIGSASPIVGVAAVARGAESAWAAYRAGHAEARARWRDRRKLEKDDTGAVNRRQEDARLAVRGAELAAEAAREKHGEGSPRHRKALEAQAAAAERYDEVRAWADAEFARIRGEIDRINEVNGRARLLLRTAGEGRSAPKEAFLRLDEIVRAYPANQLGLGGRLGVYAARWREFLTDEPREANSEGGVLPAIFGTVAMTLIMSIAVVPFGVLAALYLREYAKAGLVVSAVRIAVNNLAGVPSIVFGVFGLGFFCYVVGASLDQLLFATQLPNPTFGKGGLLWAALTLALLTLPVVIVATEEAVAAVPSSMREGSYACGASKWQTIQRIVLPRALPGIVTGMVLAIARGAGEVAPLMLVGAVKLAPELPIDGVFPFVHPERSFMHLGFHIYDLGFQSQNSEAAKPMVFTTTLLLIAIVAVLNMATVALRSRLRKKYASGQF